MSDIAERVHLGAERLDAARPGWYREIDLDLFDITSWCSCILGQLYGSFGEGRRQLDLQAGESLALGFDLVDRPAVFWRALAYAWRTLITQRLEDDRDRTC